MTPILTDLVAYQALSAEQKIITHLAYPAVLDVPRDFVDEPVVTLAEYAPEGIFLFWEEIRNTLLRASVADRLIEAATNLQTH